ALFDDHIKAMLSILDTEYTVSFLDRLFVALQLWALRQEAVNRLIELGRDPQQVRAMPVIQVVAIYLQSEISETRSELLKWMCLPYWQGQEHLDKLVERVTSKVDSSRNGCEGFLASIFL